MTNDLLVIIIFFQAATLVALLTLGLLLSVHNRRQAQALAEAQGVLEAWFIHQTKVHREAKAKENLVPDALAWIAVQADEAVEMPLKLATVQRVVGGLMAVEVLGLDGRRVVVTPLSAAELRKAQKRRKGRLAQAMDYPLLGGMHGVVSVERSILNAGDYFDLEAAQAAVKLSVPGWDEARRLWFHVLPPRGGSIPPREAGH